MIDAETPSVAERFCDSAHRYEEEAGIQNQAAAQFDDWLSQLATEQPTRIAEIGCGTGFLTRRLYARFPGCHIHATDMASAMVDRCRASIPASATLHYNVCDGQFAVFNPRPDWIVSTMCFQWFDSLHEVLEHHLKQCKVLAFSILLDGSFSAWRSAHERQGLTPGLHRCPDFDTLLQVCRTLGAAKTHGERIQLGQYHPDGRSFAKRLRAIGADKPCEGHRPVNLRPVLRHLDAGFYANYEIGFFHIEN